MFGEIKIWAVLIAAGLLASTSFGAGVWVRDAFCDAAAVRVQLSLKQGEIDALNRNITARDSANNVLKEQSEKDRLELERLQNEIETFKTTDGVCLPSRDVDGLRKLWRNGK